MRAVPVLEREILVCYDISGNRNRHRLYDCLKSMGLVPLQESVFWGFVRPAEQRQIEREIGKLLDTATDRAFIVPANMREATPFGYVQSTFERPPRSLVV